MTFLRLVVIALVVLPVLAFVVVVAARRVWPVPREWPIRFDGFPPRRYSWRVFVRGFDSGRRKYRPYT